MRVFSTFKFRDSEKKYFQIFFCHLFYFWIHSKKPSWSTFLIPTRFSLFVLVGVLFLSFVNFVQAWEVNTHRELTEQGLFIEGSKLNAYLINNLSLEGGLDASVKGGSPRELMVKGSDSEDDTPRYLRHFHEPINNKGIFNGSFDSSINWSLRPLGDQEWSWNDAREYYFKALTSPTKAERDENWGKTFRALGQIMHLLQDSANPSHVRNDIHAFDDGLHDYMARQSVTAALGNNAFNPDPSMLEKVGPAGPNGEPFANLFDRETYHGSAPEATLGTDIGVTEYTNANFFSDDTIPGQGSLFSTDIAHPTVAELVPAPIPSPYLTLSRLGSPAFPGARAAKLTGNEAVARFLLTNTHLDLLGQLQLDEAVYEGQSINLIPRAVGYSAAVLDYFFRGNIDVFQEKFILTGQTLPGRICDPTPTQENGFLQVDYEIPQNLGFEGTEDLYYERKDGTRVRIDEFTRISHAEVPSPVRWILVLDGSLGPGAPEQRGIVAKTGLAEWEYVCLH